MKNDPEAFSHEEVFVQTFIQKDYRDRLLFEIHKKRGHFLGRFNHGALKCLDMRFIERIPPPNSDPAQILHLLLAKGAPTTCYARSSCKEIDARILPLKEALKFAVGYGMPTILSCLPGQLCYLETEQELGPPDRFILVRAP